MVRGRSPAISPSWVPFPLTYVVIDQRNEIIKELKKYSKRKKFVLDKKQIDSVWIRIESALADYRGKSNDSPTVGILAVSYIFPPTTKIVDHVVRELKQNT
jgi:hypothetical protein